MRTTLKNTTALLAAFSLSFPTVVPAQQVADACEGGALAVTAETASDFGLTLSDEQLAGLEGAEVSSDIVIGTEGDRPALCLSAADLRSMGASEDQIATLTGAETAMPVEQQEAEAEPVEEEAAPAEEAAEAEPEADAPEETAEAEAAVPASGETAKAGARAEAEAEGSDTAQSEPAEADTAEADATTEAAAVAEAEEVAGQAEETAAEDPEQVSPEAREDLAAAAEEIEAQSAEEADPEVQAEVAEQEAPQDSAAANEDAEAAEVEEVVVTEADARSSSEEFSGAMDTTAGASVSSDKGGLSDFEKALLVGLGAVVVGKALSDRNKDAQVVSKSDDRVVVLEDGRYRVIRDDNELIERPGSTVRRETFEDGSTRTVVTRDNGVKIMTIRDPELRVLRRVRIAPDGTRTVLIDDITDVEPVEVAELPEPVETTSLEADADAEALRKALDRANRADRRFALYQVRNIERVRKLAPAIQLEAINFRTGSAVIDPQEAEELADLGNLIADYIRENPGEIFLVEGHTDAVGNAAMNLALSDRRAESVALALTEYFDVPPENLVVQGYGESDLKVKTLEAERANRRAAVRRITPLITASR